MVPIVISRGRVGHDRCRPLPSPRSAQNPPCVFAAAPSPLLRGAEGKAPARRRQALGTSAGMCPDWCGAFVLNCQGAAGLDRIQAKVDTDEATAAASPASLLQSRC